MIVALNFFTLQASQALPEPSALESAKTVVDIIGGLITAAAIIVGGVWAYFKFVKDRTYRPRLEVRISGSWVELGGTPFLHVEVTVKNIGASVVTLEQRGTGLAINSMAPPSRARSGPAPVWDEGPVLEILTHHAWIEPGETVADDLIAMVPRGDLPTRLDVRLVWKWEGGSGNIVVMAHKIVWPSDTTRMGPERTKDDDSAVRGRV